MKLPPETKTVLLSFSDIKNRKMLVSAIITLLGVIGVHAVAPDMVDGWIGMILAGFQSFSF